MGCVETITAHRFPKQGEFIGLRTKVVFHYGSEEFGGTIVRHDMEAPHRTIISLDDGRFVLASECQYAPQYTGGTDG